MKQSFVSVAFALAVEPGIGIGGRSMAIVRAFLIMEVRFGIAPAALVERPKGSKPIYNARVKQNPDSDFMVTIGAAWPFNQGGGLVAQLNLIPTNWDGKFILVTPKDGE